MGNGADKLNFSEELHGCIKNFIGCSYGQKNKFISSSSKGNFKPGIFSVLFFFPLLLKLFHMKTYCPLTYSLEPSLVLLLWRDSRSPWLCRPWHRTCTWCWRWGPRASSWAWTGSPHWCHSEARFHEFHLLKEKVRSDLAAKACKDSQCQGCSC